MMSSCLVELGFLR
uniref:Uncharacterized protein n=1 Tax=Arundo donax TaxID=35708 RepID=A0A0A8ZW61_ARUDO